VRSKIKHRSCIKHDRTLPGGGGSGEDGRPQEERKENICIIVALGRQQNKVCLRGELGE
jgi:hypothetical protein